MNNKKCLITDCNNKALSKGICFECEPRQLARPVSGKARCGHSSVNYFKCAHCWDRTPNEYDGLSRMTDHVALKDIDPSYDKSLEIRLGLVPAKRSA